LDLSLASGEAIPIEERAPEEVVCWGNTSTTPKGINVRNPVFDVTPHRYISAIITELGIIRPPYEEELAKLMQGRQAAASPAMAGEEGKGEAVG